MYFVVYNNPFDVVIVTWDIEGSFVHQIHAAHAGDEDLCSLIHDQLTTINRFNRHTHSFMTYILFEEFFILSFELYPFII